MATHTINKQIHLVSRPSGEASLDNFRLVESPVPAVAEGQVLVRNHYLSLDPYMRGRMNDAKSYAQPNPLNAVMQGGTVGEVVESRHAGYQVGDKVVGVACISRPRPTSAPRAGCMKLVFISIVTTPISARTLRAAACGPKWAS